MANVKLALRKDKAAIKKNGMQPIYLYVTINRKVIPIHCKLHVFKEHWNKGKELVKHGASDYIGDVTEVNNFLNNKKLDAQKIILDYETRKQPLDSVTFRKEMQGDRKTDYFGYIEKLYESKTVGKSTIADMRSKNRVLLDYLTNELNKDSLTLFEITGDFIAAYRKYLMEVRGNSKNGVFNNMKYLKIALNNAERKGDVSFNPFRVTTVKMERGRKKEFLNQDERQALEHLYESKELSPNLKNALRIFLFASYTGLRYGDLMRLKFSDIRNGRIFIRMQKNKAPLEVKLLSHARKYIPTNIREYVFTRVVNSTLNKRLKRLAKKAGIEKNVSIHIARHSFAVMALSNGVTIEKVSKLLGHKDTAVTIAFYADIEAKVIDSAIDSLENALNGLKPAA